MAITSGFFDSREGDRRYSASQMSKIFDGLITDGIFDSVGKHFSTDPGTGMNVLVNTGKAWFDSTWIVNDGIETVTIDPSDYSHDRIDAVVIEVNHGVDVRAASVKVVKGVPDSRPLRPKLVNTEDVHQHAIAYVRVRSKASKIDKSSISPIVGTSECPFVTSIVESTSIDDLFSKWEGDFDAWFSTLQDTLDSNTAAKLQNQIYALATNRFVPSSPGAYKTYLQENNGYEAGPYIDSESELVPYNKYTELLSVSAESSVPEAIQVPVVVGQYAYTHSGSVAFRIDLKTKVVSKIRDFSDMLSGDYRNALFGVDEQHAYISKYSPGVDYEGEIVKVTHEGKIVSRYKTAPNELQYKRKSPYYPGGFTAFINMPNNESRRDYGHPVTAFTKNYILFMFEDYESHMAHALMFNKNDLKPRPNKNNINGAAAKLNAPPVSGRLIDWYISDYEHDCYHVPGGPGYTQSKPLVCNCTWTYSSDVVERTNFSFDMLNESDLHATVFNEGAFVHVKNSKGIGVATYRHDVGTPQDHYHGNFVRIPGDAHTPRYPVSNQEEANNAYDPVSKRYFSMGHMYDIDTKTPEIKDSVAGKIEPIRPFSCVDNTLAYDVKGFIYYSALHGSYTVHHVEKVSSGSNPDAPDSGGGVVTIVDTKLSESSRNPVENRAIAKAINNIIREKATSDMTQPVAWDGTKFVTKPTGSIGGSAKDGVTFIPSVTSVSGGHKLSWTNDGGKNNPEAVVIKDGTNGENGKIGIAGFYSSKNEYPSDTCLKYSTQPTNWNSAELNETQGPEWNIPGSVVLLTIKSTNGDVYVTFQEVESSTRLRPLSYWISKAGKDGDGVSDSSITRYEFRTVASSGDKRPSSSNQTEMTVPKEGSIFIGEFIFGNSASSITLTFGGSTFNVNGGPFKMSANYDALFYVSSSSTIEFLNPDIVMADIGYPVRNMNGSTGNISPKIDYRWGVVASLKITLNPVESGTSNEYRFRFISGESPTTLNVPASIKWATPTNIEANRIYEVSILDDLGVMISAPKT